VFTGLLTLWAEGSRTEPFVTTSLRNLAELLSLTWSGRTGQQLAQAVESLKTTNYRAVVQNDAGGWSNLFSLLDSVQTRWDGPRHSPHSHIAAKFSDCVFEAISQPRVLRPLDLAALHALGEQRHLAKRLFLYLEGIPMHRLDHNREMVERVVDERLAATLGSRSGLKHFRPQLIRAGQAVIDIAPRYAAIQIVPRQKRGLRRTDPGYLLHVVRTRIAPISK
jgi:hypothetical protein